MADARFYDYRGPFLLGDLGKAVGGALGDGADPLFKVADVFGADAPLADGLGFLTTPFAAEGINRSAGGAWILSSRTAEKLGMLGAQVLLHESPAAAFAEVARRFYPRAGRDCGAVSRKAIDPSAKLGAGVVVELGAVIGPNVEIGDGSHIAANAVIGRGVTIGRDCYIGPNASIFYALIGDRVSLFAGVRVGSDGFGFVPSPKGAIKVPQIGRVIIQDDVELGANTMVDRGALGDTIIGEGTKIDNGVQIAHNCVIGRFVVMAALTGLAGSARIGDGSMIGGQVGVGNHITVGPGAQIAAQSGVAEDLPGGRAYGGSPARPAMEWKREIKLMARLARERRAKTDD